jgi:hypothetical protein
MSAWPTLDISCWQLQTELENVLFSIIRAKGFDEQYIDCYRMVTQFYQQRQPLCIIICGTAWTGELQQQQQQQQHATWHLSNSSSCSTEQQLTDQATKQPQHVHSSSSSSSCLSIQEYSSSCILLSWQGSSSISSALQWVPAQAAVYASTDAEGSFFSECHINM